MGLLIGPRRIIFVNNSLNSSQIEKWKIILFFPLTTSQQLLVPLASHHRTVARRPGEIGAQRVVQVALGHADRDQAAADRPSAVLRAATVKVLNHLPVGLLRQEGAGGGRQIRGHR